MGSRNSQPLSSRLWVSTKAEEMRSFTPRLFCRKQSQKKRPTTQRYSGLCCTCASWCVFDSPKVCAKRMGSFVVPLAIFLQTDSQVVETRATMSAAEKKKVDLSKQLYNTDGHNDSLLQETLKVANAGEAMDESAGMSSKDAEMAVALDLALHSCEVRKWVRSCIADKLKFNANMKVMDSLQLPCDLCFAVYCGNVRIWEQCLH